MSPPKRTRKKTLLEAGQQTLAFAVSPATSAASIAPFVAPVVPSALAVPVTPELQIPRASPGNQKSDYIKRSSSLAATVHDPIVDYKLSLRYFNKGNIQWPLVSAGDRLLRSKLFLLNLHQLRFFWILVYGLRSVVNSDPGFGGPDAFNRPGETFVWNWPSWVRIIHDLAASLVGSPADVDCWSSDLATDKSGRPKLRAAAGQVEIRYDVSRPAVGKPVWYRSEAEGAIHETTAARLVAVLCLGLPPAAIEVPSKRKANQTYMAPYQCSHLCHSIPQACLNPAHLVWERDLANKDRNGCARGNFRTCPHIPRCVWTDALGRLLPCRNRGPWICSCPGTDCHDIPTYRIDI